MVQCNFPVPKLDNGGCGLSIFFAPSTNEDLTCLWCKSHVGNAYHDDFGLHDFGHVGAKGM